MSTSTIAGFIVGNVDQVPSVASAYANLKNHSGNLGAQIAYDTAVANALALETSLTLGAGGYFAAQATTLDMLDIQINGNSLSKILTLAGNSVTAYAQGFLVNGLENRSIGKFTAGGLADFIGTGSHQQPLWRTKLTYIFA